MDSTPCLHSSFQVLHMGSGHLFISALVHRRDALPKPAPSHHCFQVFSVDFFSVSCREITHPPPLLSPQNAPHIALGPHLRPPFLGVPSALCQTPGEHSPSLHSPLESWPSWVSQDCTQRCITQCSPPCPQVTGSYSRHKQRCLHGSKRCYESKTWQGKEYRGLVQKTSLPLPSTASCCLLLFPITLSWLPLHFIASFRSLQLPSITSPSLS